MKNIWVLGPTGQLGFYLMERLLVAGVRLPRKDADLRQIEAIPEILNQRLKLSGAPELVINATAYNAVDKAETEQSECMRLNAEAPAAIAAWCAEHGAAFMHYSTNFVYSGDKTTPYVEVDEARPLSIYGRSKLEGERAVRDRHPGAVILRTSWVYSHRRENFPLAILKKAMVESELRVVDDQIGHSTYADELARFSLQIATRLIASNTDSLGGIYHLADAGAVSRFDFARELLRRASAYQPRFRDVRVLSAKTSDFKSAAERPLVTRMNMDKVARTFDVRPRPWSENLSVCLERHYAGS